MSDTVLKFFPSVEADHDLLTEVAMLRGVSLPASSPITQGQIKQVAPRLAFYLNLLYQSLTGTECPDDAGTVYATVENGSVKGLYFPALYKSPIDGVDTPVIRWGDELIPVPFQKVGKEVTIGRDSQLPNTSFEFALGSYAEGNFTHYTLQVTLINEDPNAKVSMVIYHLQTKREDPSLKLDDAWVATFRRNPEKLCSVLSLPKSGGKTVSPNAVAEGTYQALVAYPKPSTKVPDAWGIEIAPLDGGSITIYTPEGEVEVPRVVIYAPKQDVATLVAYANGSKGYQFPADARVHIGGARLNKSNKRVVTCLVSYGSTTPVKTTAQDYSW